MLFFRSLRFVATAAVVGLIGGGLPFCDGRPAGTDREVSVSLDRRQNWAVRREWSDLTPSERIEYTDAVKCLMNTPSRLPEMYHSTNLFDDFLAVHINHTWQIHLNGYFLGYHRGFLRAFEDALQSVCGYRGMQPHCHWPKYLDKPLRQSAIFDGSPSSFGSDGGSGNSLNDQAQGGACVARGPFSKHRVPYTSLSTQDAETGKAPDERAWTRSDDCLRRKLDDNMARTVANQSVIDAAINAPNIDEFRRLMDPPSVGGSGLGFHSGMHTMCGGHMRDLFIAPTDPVFYCVHAEMDMVWMAWQAQDAGDRVFGRGAVSGSKTMLDIPNTQNVSMDDMLSFGNLTPLARDRRLREMMDPTASWLGYSYA